MWQAIFDTLHVVFGGDEPVPHLALGQVAARAMAVFLIGLAIVRVGKSRLISRTTPLDVILAFILGSLFSRGITGSASISATAVAGAVLVALHWLLTALCCRYHWLGNLIKGHSRLLLEDGKPNHRNMRMSHVSEHDLLEEMRLHANLDDYRQVKAAYKERSGEISVVKHDLEPQMLDVKVAEGVQTVRIEFARKK